MTQIEMISTVAVMTDLTEQDPLVQVYLKLAVEKVLQKLYPFIIDDQGLEVPEKYHGLTCEIAAYLINKRGAEGQRSHNENGIQRSYESGDVPRSLLNRIVPYVGSLGTERSK